MTEQQYNEFLKEISKSVNRTATKLFTDGHNQHFDNTKEIALTIVDDLYNLIKYQR